MTTTFETTTPTTVKVPVHCGQEMRPKESFVTQRLFFQCTACLHNTYSVGASSHAHTVRS